MYDGLGRLARCRNASNQVTASCHYAGSRLTDLLEGNSEVTFQWGAGEPLSQIQGSSTYWYVPGSLGDPMSFNRHLYTDANPVDYSDPSGLQTTQHRPCDNKKDNPCGDDYHFIFASGPALLAFVHARPLIAKAFPKEPPANIQTGASAAGWAFGRVMDRLAGTFYCFIYDAIACGPDTPQPPEHIPDNGAIQPDFGGWHTRYVR